MNATSKILTLVIIFVASIAQAQHFDVYLGRPTSGSQTVWGGIDVDDGHISSGLRVFESEMGEDIFNGVFLSIEPGFNNPGTGGAQAPGAAAMNPGDTVTVNSLSFEVGGSTDDLFFWDGTGPVSFAPAVGVDFSIGNPTDAAAGDGSFDDHPFIILDDLDANAATFPTVGIYLASFEASLPGLDATESIFLVMGTEGLITADFLGITQGEFDLLTEEQLDEELEEVIELAAGFVETNLVPEPTSALIAICGLSIMAFRRNR